MQRAILGLNAIVDGLVRPGEGILDPRSGQSAALGGILSTLKRERKARAQGTQRAKHTQRAKERLASMLEFMRTGSSSG